MGPAKKRVSEYGSPEAQTISFGAQQYLAGAVLDDQMQVDLKPAGQPEQASLNQCQLIAQNWCSAHAKLMLASRFLCNVIDTRALIGPCSHVTSH